MPTLKYKDPVTGEYKSDIHVVGAVSSVNGKTGAVEIDNSDITEALGYTPADASTTQEKLIAGDGITIAEDGKTISAVGDGVFIATYNVTTAQEIRDAIADGKAIFVKKSSEYAPLTAANAKSLTFSSSGANTTTTIRLVDSSGAWTVSYSFSVDANSPYAAVKKGMTDAAAPAWTAAEQAAARERMGATHAGKFELIETIDLSGLTNIFNRSIEPNGAPYNYTAVMIITRVPSRPERIANIYTATNLTTNSNYVYNTPNADH